LNIIVQNALEKLAGIKPYLENNALFSTILIQTKSKNRTQGTTPSLPTHYVSGFKTG
jgi:hypothetical protein